MRKIIFAAAVAAGVLTLNSSAFATMAMHMPDGFGPVHEMKMKGHVMHMQVIKNKAGETFVVIPLSEAEKMLGKVSVEPFLVESANGQ